MQREPPFESSVDIHQVTLAELVAIAGAIEHEAVRRYAALAEAMDARGEAATAQALRAMLDEERAHVEAVEHWAAALGRPLPKAAGARRVPIDLWRAWDEVAGSARLTPYRAYAIAADSERKAFAFYSYLAAYASDPKVREQAEKLAMEELGHAALMRRWRRQAWHRERRAAEQPPSGVTSIEALHALLARREAELRARHRAMAERLRALGDEEAARLLERLDEAPSWPPAAAPALAELPGGGIVPLLVGAQESLEALSETLEDALRSSEGALFDEVEKALSNVVARMARLALLTARRVQEANATAPAA